LEDGFSPPKRFATASDELHELVSSEVGSSDFGAGDYRAGLRVLLQSMDYDPVFTERGRRIAWGELISALSGRVRAVHSMTMLPGFDRHPINEPVVITGLPRTGTTALHKLLAVDPQFQGLQGWLTSAPMPRPPRERWESHPMFRQAVRRLNKRFAAVPNQRAAHDMAAEEVDECCFILRQSFVSNLWTVTWSAATYDAWWQTQSELPAYRYYRRVLQLIGSNEPEKRWLLKNPGHIDNLDLLFEIFPDAMVIQTHRDPAKAIPSLCAVLMKNHPVMEQGRERLRADITGLRETAKWAAAMRKAEPVRQAHCNQIIDVVHGEFHRNPMTVIERIYAFLGLELAPEVQAAMLERVTAAPEMRHGKHHYDVAEFGLTEDEIRECFSAYMDRFGLNAEPSARTKAAHS
jgi:Sulfotransferase family